MKRIIIPLLLVLISSYSFSQEVLPQLQNPMSANYLAKNISKELPRLGYTQKSVKQLRKQITKDPVLINLYKAIKQNADTIYTQPVLERIQIGRRILDVSREMIYRVNMLGFIYLMEEDQKALDRINQELLAVCNFKDWNPSHFLDVGEMAFGVSLALDWTQNNLPESTIELAKIALKEKALEKTWPKNGKVWGISKATNNWNQVCSGGLIAASIVLAEDYPELSSKTISRALEGLPNALAAYGPDGAFPEGPTYWSYATRYSVATIAMFKSALGTDFGLSDVPGFKESATFRTLCNAPSGSYYNYSDSDEQRKIYGDEILAWFAAESGMKAYFEEDRFLMPADKMGKLSRTMGIGMLWIANFKEKSGAQLPNAWKGDGVNPIAVFKSNKGLFLGCKGGRAGISHGNMDAGSFVLELNGVRWSLEIGKEEYHDIEKTGFNLWGNGQDAERWQLESKNNFGHSSISVNNSNFIHDAFAPIVDFSDDSTPFATIDLTPLYGENITRLLRTFTKESDSSVTIKDEIVPSDSTELVTWQMITTADVELKKGEAILKQDGKQLKLQILSHPDFYFSVVSLNPAPMFLDKKIDGLKRLEIRIPKWAMEEDETILIVKLSDL